MSGQIFTHLIPTPCIVDMSKDEKVYGGGIRDGQMQRAGRHTAGAGQGVLRTAGTARAG